MARIVYSFERKLVILIIIIALLICTVLELSRNYVFYVTYISIYATWNSYSYSYSQSNDHTISTSSIIDHSLNCTSADGSRVLINDKDAFCLDGSKPVYYIRHGYGTGKDKWNIFFEGGGWCYDLRACQRRSYGHVGTSKNYPYCLKAANMTFYQSGDPMKNPLMYNWNTIHIKYCDASSYAGDAVHVYKGKKLYFKGRKNRDAFINNLLRIGMHTASDILISGCSAGGLGVLLGIDDMADTIHAVNPSAKIRGLTNSAYFVDYTGDRYYTKRRDWKEEAVVDGMIDYAGHMRKVFTFANMSAGAHRRCLSQYDHVTGLHWNYTHFAPATSCVFAKHTLAHVTTPIFMIQPQYDFWQIWHVFGSPYNISLTNAKGKLIVQQVSSLLLTRQQHGVFFDACTHHCTSCSDELEDSWHGAHIRSTVDKGIGSTPAQAFARWYGDVSIDDMISKGRHKLYRNTTTINKKHYHIQKGVYPCDSCCLCRA